MLLLIRARHPACSFHGIGHSMGGALLAIAQILRPGLFRSLVCVRAEPADRYRYRRHSAQLLVEPILFPPTTEETPLAVAAEKRRTSWPTAQAARQQLEQRGAFFRWDRRAMTAYIEHGFRWGNPPDGGSPVWTLKCTPRAEAASFRGTPGMTLYWHRLSEIACRVLLVR